MDSGPRFDGHRALYRDCIMAPTNIDRSPDDDVYISCLGCPATCFSVLIVSWKLSHTSRQGKVFYNQLWRAVLAIIRMVNKTEHRN